MHSIFNSLLDTDALIFLGWPIAHDKASGTSANEIAHTAPNLILLHLTLHLNRARTFSDSTEPLSHPPTFASQLEAESSPILARLPHRNLTGIQTSATLSLAGYSPILIQAPPKHRLCGSRTLLSQPSVHLCQTIISTLKVPPSLKQPWLLRT